MTHGVSHGHVTDRRHVTPKVLEVVRSAILATSTAWLLVDRLETDGRSTYLVRSRLCYTVMRLSVVAARNVMYCG